MRNMNQNLTSKGMSNNQYTYDFVGGQVIVGMRTTSQVSHTGLSQYLSSKASVNTIEVLMSPKVTTHPTQGASGEILLLALSNVDKQSVIDVIVLLEQHPEVAYAEPNYIDYEDDFIESDQQLSPSRTSLLWNLEMIRVPEAWSITTGSSSIKVGIIDSGIDHMHPNLIRNVDPSLGHDFVLDIPDASDNRPGGHGTFVAGIIGATGSNSFNMRGVAPNVTLIALKTRNDQTGGYLTSDSIRAIEYANQIGIHIINRSLGSNGHSQALENAIRYFNGLFIASAGNNSRDIDIEPRFPASLNIPNMITVGNSNQSDQRSTTSNFGRTTVDLFAPGNSLISTVPGGTFRVAGGTSYAAPHVAGAAVLALAENRLLSPIELKTAILNTVDSVPALANLSVTGGRLNVGRLLEYVENNAPMIPTWGVPHNVRISHTTTTSITLVWDTPIDRSNITGYQIYRNGMEIGQVDTYSPRVYVDSELIPNTSYSYTVRSYAISEHSNVATGKTQSETVIPEPTPPAPELTIVYRVNGEGSNRQMLVITNRSSNYIPNRFRLQFDFSGTAPNIEWPATWTTPTGNHFDTTVNEALNTGRTVSIPMGAGANTRLHNVIVNGIPAMRE